jgi:hypothetical protein
VAIRIEKRQSDGCGIPAAFGASFPPHRSLQLIGDAAEDHAYRINTCKSEGESLTRDNYESSSKRVTIGELSVIDRAIVAPELAVNAERFSRRFAFCGEFCARFAALRTSQLSVSPVMAGAYPGRSMATSGERQPDSRMAIARGHNGVSTGMRISMARIIAVPFC